MRVALRRLRAALALFEKAFPEGGFEPFRSEAKRIASALGEARDQDAFGALVSSGPLKLFPNDESFAALLAASSSRRSIAYGQARQIVRAPATSRFVLELQAYAASRGWRRKMSANDLSRLAQLARIFAAEAIDRLYQRARKRGKGLMGLAPDQRHRLRISLKNLRYACDFFASVFDAPRDVKRFTKALGALQDSLGASNDAVVALKTVAELEQNAGQAAGRAVGIVLGWCGREADAPDIHLRAYWLAFKKARCFWQ
jgi:CHAD domain-containing protein